MLTKPNTRRLIFVLSIVSPHDAGTRGRSLPTTTTSILAIGVAAVIGGVGIASVMWLANPALAHTADRRSQGLDPNLAHNNADIRSEGGVNHLRPSAASKQKGYRLVVVAPQDVDKNFARNGKDSKGTPPSPATEEASVIDREALLSTGDETSPPVDTVMPLRQLQSSL